ncbi:MAG TPA: hypothetical protein VJK30_00025 [Coxiellaceae bacterium]|nr:hypothetical protein [Coxiellaceae bacterium]
MRDETTPEQIVFAFSVDYDGCISPAEFSDKNVEQNIHTANLIRHFLDAVKNKIKDKNNVKIIVRLLIGSARQSKLVDEFNRLGNQNGSCFIAFDILLDRLKTACENDPTLSQHELDIDIFPLLLEDIQRNLTIGTTFRRREVYTQEFTRQCIAKHVPGDGSKRVLLRTQMHCMASLFPDAEIDFQFFDDRKNLLDPLLTFFSSCPQCIPKIKFTAYQYECGDLIRSYDHIIGCGYIDYDYPKNTNFFYGWIMRQAVTLPPLTLYADVTIRKIFELTDQKKRDLQYKLLTPMALNQKILTETQTVLNKLHCGLFDYFYRTKDLEKMKLCAQNGMIDSITSFEQLQILCMHYLEKDQCESFTFISKVISRCVDAHEDHKSFTIAIITIFENAKQQKKLLRHQLAMLSRHTTQHFQIDLISKLSSLEQAHITLDEYETMRRAINLVNTKFLESLFSTAFHAIGTYLIGHHENYTRDYLRENPKILLEFIARSEFHLLFNIIKHTNISKEEITSDTYTKLFLNMINLSWVSLNEIHKLVEIAADWFNENFKQFLMTQNTEQFICWAYKHDDVVFAFKNLLSKEKWGLLFQQAIQKRSVDFILKLQKEKIDFMPLLPADQLHKILEWLFKDNKTKLEDKLIACNYLVARSLLEIKYHECVSNLLSHIFSNDRLIITDFCKLSLDFFAFVELGDLKQKVAEFFDIIEPCKELTITHCETLDAFIKHIPQSKNNDPELFIYLFQEFLGETKKRMSGCYKGTLNPHDSVRKKIDGHTKRIQQKHSITSPESSVQTKYTRRVELFELLNLMLSLRADIKSNEVVLLWLKWSQLPRGFNAGSVRTAIELLTSNYCGLFPKNSDQKFIERELDVSWQASPAH